MSQLSDFFDGLTTVEWTLLVLGTFLMIFGRAAIDALRNIYNLD